MKGNGQIVMNLLQAPQDRFAILHLKNTPELNKMRFWGIEQLKKLGDYDKVMKLENYELVYMADFADFPELDAKNQNTLLEQIYHKFNVDHPTDYNSHSLSVSDVVILHKDGKNSIHYVDSVGFTELLPIFVLDYPAMEIKETEDSTYAN